MQRLTICKECVPYCDIVIIIDMYLAQTVKRLPAMQETWVRSLGQEDPWRRKWQPTTVYLPGESHGWRSLVGYSPWGSQRVRHNWPTSLSLSSFMVLGSSSKTFGMFWAIRAVGLPFSILFGPLSSVPEISSEPSRWNGYHVIHNKTLPPQPSLC